MFRPYNYQSLIAWTVGSLAGNHAYYETKKRRTGVNSTIENPASKIWDDYSAYRNAGGIMGSEEYIHHRAKIDSCRARLGEFDSSLAQEVISSLSILEKKVDFFESSIQEGKISKSVLESVLGIYSGINRIKEGNLEQTGFYKKYFNTIIWLEVCHEDKPDLWNDYVTLIERFATCLKVVMALQPDLWNAVNIELSQRNAQTPLGLKMAIWEFIKLPPNAKSY